MTVGEVAAWLKVSRDWLYDEVEAGKFPVVRVGRRLRFRPRAVQDYLDGTWTPLRQREPSAP
jgi:excisionase family DNA binding protein